MDIFDGSPNTAALGRMRHPKHLSLQQRIVGGSSTDPVLHLVLGLLNRDGAAGDVIGIIPNDGSGRKAIRHGVIDQ